MSVTFLPVHTSERSGGVGNVPGAKSIGRHFAGSSVAAAASGALACGLVLAIAPAPGLALEDGLAFAALPSRAFSGLDVAVAAGSLAVFAPGTSLYAAKPTPTPAAR